MAVYDIIDIAMPILWRVPFFSVSVDFLERDDIKRGFPFYSVVLGASDNEGVGFDKY